jgi:exopolysaccharide biosynthesis polyprenyl glycosylphosphotransferase
VSRVVLACTLATASLSVFMLTGSREALSLRVVAGFWVFVVIAELTGRSIITTAAHYFTTRAVTIPRAVIVGSGRRAVHVFHAMRQLEAYEILGFVDTIEEGREVPEEIRPHLIASLDGFEALVSGRAIDCVLIALPVKTCCEDIERVIGICERIGVESQFFPHLLFPVSKARSALDQDMGIPAVRLQLVADDGRLVVKRVIDILGAVAGLVVLSPVMLLCALAIKLTSRGPIFFAQTRYGFNRRQFRMLKFRTMVENAEQLQAMLEPLNEVRGPMFKIRADPRITRIGRILRKTSLDELPQLVNVLKGEMSLVGPRPMSIRDVMQFNETSLMRRFSVKPGLTGLWQVTGRSNADFENCMSLDMTYIDNWSLMLDVRILLKTVPVVLSGSGAM